MKIAVVEDRFADMRDCSPEGVNMAHMQSVELLLHGMVQEMGWGGFAADSVCFFDVLALHWFLTLSEHSR